MVKSMTGFAAATGEMEIDGRRFAFQWDLRAVNGRGLDLRFRMPDWLDGLEPQLRKALGAVAKRGNVTLSLKLQREDSSAGLRANPEALAAAVDLIMAAERQAEERGLGLAPMTAADLLAMRGVVEQGAETVDPAPVVAALMPHAQDLIQRFDQARADEGRALDAVLKAQLAQIAELATAARAATSDRRQHQADALKAALTRLQDAAPNVEEARFEQELALIAVKSDITEELDRLDAHVVSAQDLLGQSDPVGRKLDFLMQEFNREANTLCSKSQNAALTRIGLDLKTVIDQMREQVQNLE